MAIRNDTILQGLKQERDRILEALKPIDTKTLQAQLAAIEQTIAIYEPRVTEQAKNRLPKILKAASKIRSDSENGNGKRGKLSQAQQRAMNIVSVLRDPASANRRGMAPYINSGYLTRNAKGEYLITTKGKHKLQELTGSDAPTP